MTREKNFLQKLRKRIYGCDEGAGNKRLNMKRISAGGVVVNGKKVCLSFDKIWVLPKGGVKKGESFLQFNPARIKISQGQTDSIGGVRG